MRASILLAVQHAEEETVRSSEADAGMSGSSTMDVYDNEDERVSGAEGDSCRRQQSGRQAGCENGRL